MHRYRPVPGHFPTDPEDIGTTWDFSASAWFQAPGKAWGSFAAQSLSWHCRAAVARFFPRRVDDGELSYWPRHGYDLHMAMSSIRFGQLSPCEWIGAPRVAFQVRVILLSGKNMGGSRWNETDCLLLRSIHYMLRSRSIYTQTSELWRRACATFSSSSSSAAGQCAHSALHCSVLHIIPCIFGTTGRVRYSMARVHTDLAVARTHCTLDADLHSSLVRSAVRHPLRVRRAPMARSFRFGRYVTVGAGARGLRRVLPYRFSTFVRSCIALVVYVRETATL